MVQLTASPLLDGLEREFQVPANRPGKIERPIRELLRSLRRFERDLDEYCMAAKGQSLRETWAAIHQRLPPPNMLPSRLNQTLDQAITDVGDPKIGQIHAVVLHAQKLGIIAESEAKIYRLYRPEGVVPRAEAALHSPYPTQPSIGSYAGDPSSQSLSPNRSRAPRTGRIIRERRSLSLASNRLIFSSFLPKDCGRGRSGSKAAAPFSKKVFCH
jgi:hypothetical protein